MIAAGSTGALTAAFLSGEIPSSDSFGAEPQSIS